MKKLFITFGVVAAQCLAQSHTDPVSGGAKMLYNITKSDVLKSAEEMPEANYSFKPAATVRSFGQLVGHVADGQYEFCAPVLGDSKDHPSIEKTKTSKEDLVQALKDAFAYCDAAYNSMTDTHAIEMVKFGPREMSKIAILNFNSGHNFEHYGNLVTYLRIKGLVPPSSQN